MCYSRLSYTAQYKVVKMSPAFTSSNIKVMLRPQHIHPVKYNI